MVEMRFNANEVEPMRDYQAIPEGEYLAEIISSEMKVTNSGTGEYLELVWKVTEGDHKDQQIWDRMNMENPSVKAVEIGQQRLSSICRALEVMEMARTEELHNKPCPIRVVVVEKMGYKPQNEITSYGVVDVPF